MGHFTKAEVLRMQAQGTANRAGTAPEPVKARRKPGTGDLAKRKAWWAEMARGAGIFHPWRLYSEANRRDKWGIIERTKKQRTDAYLAVIGHFKNSLPRLPLIVTMTRYGPKPLDTDNLARAMKAVQDGIADAWGVDDGNPVWTWVRKQETAPFYGVRIEIHADDSRSQRNCK